MGTLSFCVKFLHGKHDGPVKDLKIIDHDDVKNLTIYMGFFWNFIFSTLYFTKFLGPFHCLIS